MLAPVTCSRLEFPTQIAVGVAVAVNDKLGDETRLYVWVLVQFRPLVAVTVYTPAAEVVMLLLVEEVDQT